MPSGNRQGVQRADDATIISQATKFWSQRSTTGFVSPSRKLLCPAAKASGAAHSPLPSQESPGDDVLAVEEAIVEAAKILPFQGILENFVHQNPLAPFEHMPFKEGVHHVHELEKYMAPGERAFHLAQIDPRKRVNEAVAELAGVFLDRGAAKWTAPNRDKGFLYFFAALEGLGFSLWRHGARKVAKAILADAEVLGDAFFDDASIRHRCVAIILDYLNFCAVPRAEWTDAIRAAMLESKGWISMFRRMEAVPAEMPSNATVRLVEVVAVRCILIQSSVSSLAHGLGMHDRSSIGRWLQSCVKRRGDDDSHERRGTAEAFHREQARAAHEAIHSRWGQQNLRERLGNMLASAQKDEGGHVLHNSALSCARQDVDLQDTMEREFRDTLIEAVGVRSIPPPSGTRPRLQVWTCIDDRYESVRRLIEGTNPENIETYGVPGFFGLRINYHPADGRNPVVLAPFGSQPNHTLRESLVDAGSSRVAEYGKRRYQIAWMKAMWERGSFSPCVSLLCSTIFAPLLLLRLCVLCYAPLWKRDTMDKILARLVPAVQTTFDRPMSAEEAADMLGLTMIEIGMAKSFAPLVLVMGHGNRSTNNPFLNAYNCGACQGRDGGPNARLVARLANDPEVRAALIKAHGISIPADTVFVGAAHNTCDESMQYFDEDLIPATHRQRFAAVQRTIDKCLARNAQERCYRFLLAKPASSGEALQHVRRRAADYSEVRPELNHATNAAVIVGRRDLTKGRFLDRRCFLPSYDPLGDDERGTSLERVLTPSLLVCSGINLEYLFSTADTDGHGAGTKVPLNVVGNIGVLQGVSGDIRPGLPSQMTEMHVPIRALFIVDAPIARVEAVLSRNPRLMNLVRNEWVQLIVRDPETSVFFKQRAGSYLPVESSVTDTHVSFEAHRRHGMNVARRESVYYGFAIVGTIASCFGPIAAHAMASLHGHSAAVLAHGTLLDQFGAVCAAAAASPQGAFIAFMATALTLPVLHFARRYLHGELLYGRFCAQCVGLLLGFNIVATAPDLHHALAGWTLFGFCSTFLIGTYNDRPSVRNNATFAFAVYKIGDFAMLSAACCTAHGSFVPVPGLEPVAAASVLLAAMCKSSQFPLSVLFARSMEGPTPSSALGYAGLSAHIGVVLLVTTSALWLPFEWARYAIAGVGGFTVVSASLVARTRPDRKGAIAYATSASLGAIFVVLSMGYTELSLWLSLGHAAFRMTQILRAPNIIADTNAVRAAMNGTLPWPTSPPDWIYRLAWRLRRFDTDFHFMNALQALVRDDRHVRSKPLRLWVQWVLTAVIVIIAGFPYTPVAHWKEKWLADAALADWHGAAAWAAVDFVVSVLLMRIVFTKIIDSRKFH